MTDKTPKKTVGNLTQNTTGHSHELLLALSRAAQSIQRARTEEEVYRAVGDQIKSLGEDVALYIFNDDRNSFALAHTSYTPEVVRAVEKLAGGQALGYEVIFPPDSIYARNLRNGKAEYIQWKKEYIASVLPPLLRPLVGQFIKLLKIKQGILAPLCADEESLGLMVVNGSSLTEDDVPAMESFASQIAISLRNVRLTQQMRAELQVRKQVEETLRVQSAALESAANAIAITDRSGIIQWVNPAWVALTGYTKAETIGRNPRIIKSGAHEPKFYKDLWETILAGKVWRGEMTNRRKDGSLYYEEQTITPVVDEMQTVTHFIAIKLDITERKQSLASLERLAQTDALTGINNRRHLFELAAHEFDVARRYNRPLSIIMFDLDHFKDINDTFGHLLGDRLLVSVTDITRAQLRNADLIGRYGGEEFLIILPMTESSQAGLLAERIRSGVEALRIETENGTATVTVSIGIAEMVHVPMDSSVDEIVRRADEALYAAKQAGRNRTVLFKPGRTGSS